MHLAKLYIYFLQYEHSDHPFSLLLQEFAEIVASQGSAFGVAVIISSCADVAGAAIASHSDPEIQESGMLAFMLALHKSVEKYSVKFEAQQAIEKAKA